MKASNTPQTEPPQVLKGKTAIVTGAGRGIGRAEAIALAAHGARIVAVARSESAESVASEIEEIGGEAIAVQASVASDSEAESVVRTALDTYGSVDILVNNAGLRIGGGLLSTSVEDWHESVAVNADGHFFMTRHAAKAMVERGQGGRIINTASAAWLYPQGPQLAYAASKSAVVGFTWGVAWELKEYGITCNAVAPFGRTRTSEQALADYEAELSKGAAPTEIGELLRNYPAPEHAAPLVVYLASDEAADITGLVFRTGGGKVACYSHPAEINQAFVDVSDGNTWTFRELQERVPNEVLNGVQSWWNTSR